MKSAIDKTTVDMALINTYFDFEDYNDPIKTYIDDRFYYDMVSFAKKSHNVYIMKNKAEVQDGFFHYTPDGDEKEFVSIERIDTQLSAPGSDGVIFCK